jgi:hypothetical protein
MQVTNFLHADVAMPVPRSPGQNVPFRLSLRCALNQAEVKAAPHKMLLHDAVLVSYYPRQVKIAELPLDSFRMLQVCLSVELWVGGCVLRVELLPRVAKGVTKAGRRKGVCHTFSGVFSVVTPLRASLVSALAFPASTQCNTPLSTYFYCQTHVHPQALEWEDQYSSATPPANEHPMPLPRSGSKGNLAEGMGGRRNSTGNLAENGVPEMGE